MVWSKAGVETPKYACFPRSVNETGKMRVVFCDLHVRHTRKRSADVTRLGVRARIHTHMRLPAYTHVRARRSGPIL